MKNIDFLTIERGKRLRKLRKAILDLNIEQFAKLVGVSRPTMSYWENAVNTGLTLNGAQKISYALRNTQHPVEVDWLLYGDEKDNNTIKNNNPMDKMRKEIDLFLELDKNAEIMKVQDNTVNPIFEKGDIVGGIWKPYEQIKDFKNYIIIQNNEKIIKTLKTINNICYVINYNGFEKPNIEKINIKKKSLIARIIRHWSLDV